MSGFAALSSASSKTKKVKKVKAAAAPTLVPSLDALAGGCWGDMSDDDEDGFGFDLPPMVALKTDDDEAVVEEEEEEDEPSSEEEEESEDEEEEEAPAPAAPAVPKEPVKKEVVCQLSKKELKKRKADVKGLKRKAQFQEKLREVCAEE